MSTWTEEMAELFEDLRSEDEFAATLVYPEGFSYPEYVSPDGAEYVSPDGANYATRARGATLTGIKMALSLGFQMQVSGYQRKADTSFDALRSEVVTAGLYSPTTSSSPATVRPSVTVNGEAFMVLDVKDDNASDPTVKLILAALQ